MSNDKQPYVEYHVAISGVDSDTVTVKDCFDTDIFELEYKQIYAQHGNYSWDTNQGYTSRSDCEVDYKQTDQGIEFTFTPEKDSNGQYFPWYGFCYQLRVREGVSDELIKQALDNNGNGSSRNTAYFGEEEAYADWNYTYNPVGKSIITYPNQGNNYTAEFKIVVNPDGVTMNNGEKFEVVDTLKNLQYIYDSVAVKIGDDIHADYETTLGEDDDGNDTLTWIVPDKTRIEITYKAKVQGTGSVTYSNTVSILDKYKSETGDQQVSVEYGGIRFRIFI